MRCAFMSIFSSRVDTREAHKVNIYQWRKRNTHTHTHTHMNHKSLHILIQTSLTQKHTITQKHTRTYTCTHTHTLLSYTHLSLFEFHFPVWPPSAAHQTPGEMRIGCVGLFMKEGSHTHTHTHTHISILDYFHEKRQHLALL